jgi:hypothetical protein
MEVLPSSLQAAANMRELFGTILNSKRSGSLGPACILLGLCMLLSAEWWPAAPVVTGMAIVALGATCAMLARVRRSPARLPAMLVHLAVYGSLWAIFVGAALHAANTRSGPRLNAATIFDVVLSILPMGLAAWLAWAGCDAADAGDASHRG